MRSVILLPVMTREVVEEVEPEAVAPVDTHQPNLRNRAVARRARSTRQRSSRHVGRVYPVTQPAQLLPSDPFVIGVCRRCGRRGLVTPTRICAGWVNTEAKLNPWSAKLGMRGRAPEKRSVKCIERGKRQHAKTSLRIRIRANVKQFLAQLNKAKAQLIIDNHGK